MQREDAFGSYHPAITFLFFAGAILSCMFFRHPAFLVASLVLAYSYYVTLKGVEAWGLLKFLVPIFVIISLINPVFSTYGNTVLFEYFDGRAYTLEALLYGANTACMFVSMIVWFACYSIVMTSDKFMYLFGGLAPSITLTLTMALRLVPLYGSKVKQFAAARASLGRSVETGTNKERVEHASSLVSQLTTWAFENAATTADSLSSRGYGVGKRTNFSMYRFAGRDKVLLLVLFVALAAALGSAISGAQAIEFYPVVVMAPVGFLFAVGLVSYAAFLAVPTVVNVKEYLLWRNSLSKI